MHASDSSSASANATNRHNSTDTRFVWSLAQCSSSLLLEQYIGRWHMLIIHGCLALFSGLFASCSDTHCTSECISNFTSHRMQPMPSSVRCTMHKLSTLIESSQMMAGNDHGVGFVGPGWLTAHIYKDAGTTPSVLWTQSMVWCKQLLTVCRKSSEQVIGKTYQYEVKSDTDQPRYSEHLTYRKMARLTDSRRILIGHTSDYPKF